MPLEERQVEPDDGFLLPLWTDPCSCSSSSSSLPSAAMAALRNKKNYETQLDKISGVRLTLETQVRPSCLNNRLALRSVSHPRSRNSRL
jgi:hypothetical protein